MKLRVGNKWNSWLNGEWAKHVRDRRLTSKARRNWSKEIIRKELKLLQDSPS